MKGLALMLTAALLAFVLTACGCSADTSGNSGDPQSGSTMTDSGSTNGGSSANTGSSTNSGSVANNPQNGTAADKDNANGTQNDTPLENSLHDAANGIGSAVGDVANGIGNAVDDMTGQGTSATGDVTYGQMLNRGRIGSVR